MKASSDFEILKKKLAVLVGLRVQRCGLLIWPDEEGAKETSTSLHLELASKSGSPIEVTIGTCPDGQTPEVEFESWPEQFSLGDLRSRITAWQEPGFWNPEDSHGCEYFNVSGADEYQGVIGHSLKDIYILYFKEKPPLPTGVRLEFDSGLTLFVVPGVSGSTVFREIPANWFPSPCDEMRVAQIA
jgi:hypothetical protein